VNPASRGNGAVGDIRLAVRGPKIIN
jgi:hypothetical protein